MDLSTTLNILVLVLSLGTLYAWYQFARILRKKCDTCSLDLETNPFKSKCFIGAIFFTVALLLAVYVSTLVL